MRLAVLVVALVVAGRSALAAPACKVTSACNIDPVSTKTGLLDPGNNCCTATTCNIDSNVAISGASCTLDFGTRDVTFTGKLTLGGSALTLKAGRFTFAGVVDGTSASGVGGSLTVQTTGDALSAVQVTGNGSINVSGKTGGGQVHVFADGGVAILKGFLHADATTAGDGGDVRIETTAGDVRTDFPVTASGAGGGDGGAITIRGPGKLSLPANGSELIANGPSGSVDVLVGGAVELGPSSEVKADDDVEIEGGSVLAQGAIAVVPGITADVTLTADADGVTISRPGTSPAITAGDDASVELGADASSPTAQITIAGVLDLHAPFSEADTGTLDAHATGDIAVQSRIDGTGPNSSIHIESAQGSVTVQERILANDASEAGEIDLSAGNDVVLASGGQIEAQGTTNVDGGDGGAINIFAGRDVLLRDAGGTGDSYLKASGSGSGSHGDVEITAGRNVVLGAKAHILLMQGTASFGTVAISAGDPIAGISGNVTIAGTIDARAGGGGASGVVAPGAQVSISGCDVTVQLNGRVDVRANGVGTVNGVNSIVVRHAFSAAGQILADASVGRNDFVATTTPPTLATVTPAFTGVSRPACTQDDQPVGCLMPCPTCGNGGEPEWPEECDPGGGPNCTAVSVGDATNWAFCSDTCTRVPEPGTSDPAANCDDDNPCTDDSCDETLGCLHTLRAAGSTCNDGNACTGTPEQPDTCDAAGQCSGAVVVCNDGKACNGVETCDPAIGCVDGTAPNCDDGNPCTTDACNDAVGCTHANNTGPCSDGDACTAGDTCHDGFCQSGSPMTCTGTQVCVAGTCQEKSCTTTADCPNDGDVCNGQLVCSNETDTCIAVPPPDCSDDGDACNGVKHCDAVQGCVTSPAVTCEDGNVCNGIATCNHDTGACVAPVGVLDCDDGNACTVDSCDAVTGCKHQTIAGCQACSPGDACDDADDCTTDACTNGVCQHESVGSECCSFDAQCDDGDACNGTETCVGHVCQGGTEEGVGAPCGDLCHPSASCQGADGARACVPGEALTCDDGQFCTVDACDPALGCVATAVPGCCSVDADCNDHDLCTTDACDTEAHTCTHVAVSESCMECSSATDCSPLGVCGGQDCVGGVCAPVTTACDDGDACTADSCPDAGGCRHDAIAGCCHGASECDDGDACTVDSCSGTCEHTALASWSGADCRLDGVAATLGGGISGKTLKRLRKQLAIVRKTRARAEKASGKKRAKLQAQAGKQLLTMEKLVRKARGKTIPPDTADAIVAAIEGASAALKQVQ